MKIGILGGSFNPAHLGHIKISLTAIELLNLDKIYWLITEQNPLKSSQEYLPLDLRIKKAKNIIDKNNIEIISTEEKTKSNYAIDNLRYIKLNNADQFIFLMGADSFISLDKWKDYDDIIQLFPFSIFNRNFLVYQLFIFYLFFCYNLFILNYNSFFLFF